MSRSRMIRWMHLGAVAILLTACANGPCHPLRHPELAQQAQPTGGAGSTAGDNKGAGDPKVVDNRIYVAKADGSLQCGMAKGQTPQDMEKQLEGIKVYSRENRPDGRMHIQVCGSATGQVNVFEIPSTSLKDAEKRGFKKFEL